jgi:hypothetical protein
MPRKKEMNAESLKKVLVDNIDGISTGKVDARTANSVCASVRTLCSIVKLEKDIAKAARKSPTKSTKKFAGLT